MPETSGPDNKKLAEDISAMSADFEFEPLPPKIETPPDYGRRIKILTAAIIVAVAAYTAGWFWIGATLENAVRSQAAKGVIDCTDIAAKGYPFRIGLTCSKASYAAP
ncbi:MAG: DUF2125 domain-containing protein, partial [Notoacmeibacter sp.]